MPVYLRKRIVSSLFRPTRLLCSPCRTGARPRPILGWYEPYLWLDQDQIDKQDDKVMLDVFVAEAAAVLAHREADIVATGFVTGAFAP